MEPHPDVSLETLLDSLPVEPRVRGNREVRITSIAIDSREVRQGSLFVALRGRHTDGHRYIHEAIERGARAVVTQERWENGEVTSVWVNDSAIALSRFADVLAGRPSQHLRVVGVTGTDGKTTTVHMIAAIAQAAGLRCGTIGTIGARFGEIDWQLEHTTPPAPRVHELLAQMRADGAEAAAMEVSSHALVQHRVDDVRFAIGALTNLTRDHLDFHASVDDYAAAKRRLFDLARACVFNADDERGRAWAEDLRCEKPIATYALREAADVRADSLESRARGSSFEVGGQRFELKLAGRFNVLNALCAIAVARFLGIADRDAARGLGALQRVPGRMERLSGSGIDAIVDYAHTPEALANVLSAAREGARGRVVAVFGCGGDRDRGKRAEMGRAAARGADFSYVTSDNPRTEDPRAIADDILAGVGGAPHAVELDRRRAIDRAICEADPGDLVVIAGKGHERYQVVGIDAVPFDDVEVAQASLEARAKVAR